MFKNRFIKSVIIVIAVVLVALAVRETITTASNESSMDNAFHTPPMSDYKPVDYSFHTPELTHN